MIWNFLIFTEKEEEEEEEEEAAEEGVTGNIGKAVPFAGVVAGAAVSVVEESVTGLFKKTFILTKGKDDTLPNLL